MANNTIEYRIAGISTHTCKPISVRQQLETDRDFGQTESVRFHNSHSPLRQEIVDYLTEQLPKGTHIYGVDFLDINPLSTDETHSIH